MNQMDWFRLKFLNQWCFACLKVNQHFQFYGISLPSKGDWKVLVEDVKTKSVDLKGRRVIPSKGALMMTDNPNDIPLVFSDTYSTGTTFPTSLIYPLHTMRDIVGTILEVNPVAYNPTTEKLELVTSC